MLDEKKFSHITRNLLMTMAANGRIKEAGKVISQFGEIMQAARGTVEVTIISAEVLKKKQLEAITAGVMGMVGSGKSVRTFVESRTCDCAVVSSCYFSPLIFSQQAQLPVFCF
jgi:F0F1-type ATP synthase delta subunit